MSHAPAYQWVLPATLICALLLVGCDNGPAEPEPVASQITLYGGDSQVAPAGSRLPMPLAVRVTDSGNRGVPDVRIHWQVTSGAGEFWSWPEERSLLQPLTVTDASGVARVLFQPTEPGRSMVAAMVAGLQGSPVTFTISATEAADVVIRFGPLFDCTPDDPNTFVGPDRSSDVAVPVGARVEWVYMEWAHPGCTARIISTSVPPGGEPFDSGILRPGEGFQFVPGVAGTWAYSDAINGGSGTLTATAP